MLEAIYICICICLFGSLRLGQCHHQLISFQKIYDLYGLEHHTMEINGDVTMVTNNKQTNKQTSEYRATHVIDT